MTTEFILQILCFWTVSGVFLGVVLMNVGVWDNTNRFQSTFLAILLGPAVFTLAICILIYDALGNLGKSKD